MNGLTEKQILFVEAYLANSNATEAAKKAGYSAKTAYSQGQRLLKNVEIQARLQKRVEKAIMSADEVLSQLADIARADWKDFLEIKLDKDGRVVDTMLRLTDKIKALELVGKHHKLFTDKTEVSKLADTAAVSQAIVDRLTGDGWSERDAWSFVNRRYQEVSTAVN